MHFLNFSLNMIKINNVLISNEIFEEQFICDLSKCKGACCAEGEDGAPLSFNESVLLDEISSIVEPYLSKEGKKSIKKHGAYYKNNEGELKTTLNYDEGPCSFVIKEKGIYKCGIEKAWEQKEITFQKPISCHLYPIREAKYGEHIVLNYEKWSICSAACKLGKSKKMPVFKFLKDALIRRFGDDFYNQALAVHKEYFDK